MIPAPAKAFWFTGGISLFILALFVLFVLIALSLRDVQFEMSREDLRIHARLYGRTIPMESLIVNEARAVDLRRDRELNPRWRTNGAGLPGYAAGWFKLRSGEKALLFLTDRTQAVYVPTREGYSVLLSVEHPDRFVDTLRRYAST
jgi:hypothetical protein